MGLLGRPTGWLSGYQLADGPTSYSVAQVPISLGFLVTDLSPVESQRFLVKILHFDLSHKTETGYPPGLQDHFFFFFLSFVDSSFLAMRPAFRLAFRLDQLAVWGRPNPSAWLLVLLGLPTRSSTSPPLGHLGSLPASFPAIS